MYQNCASCLEWSVIAKKILKQRDPFLLLMSCRVTPYTSVGLSPCQLMTGREIRTPWLHWNPTWNRFFRAMKQLEQYEESKTAYCQFFDKRHGVRPLSVLQPGDSVRVKLDQQKGWKTSGKVIARSLTPQSYVIQTHFREMHRNRRHLHIAISPERGEPHREGLHLPNQDTASDCGALKSDVSCTLFYKHTA